MYSYEEYLAQGINAEDAQCSYDDYSDVYHDSHNDSYWKIPLDEVIKDVDYLPIDI